MSIKSTKCRQCLHGATIGITGITRRTLKLNMGGAVLYITPGKDGEIEVTLNSENLVEGDYAVARWNDARWICNTRLGGSL
jgi:hypothetical protein